MTDLPRFQQPEPDQFPHDLEGTKACVRFMLDQVDELIKTMKAGKLAPFDFARELKLLTTSAQFDAFSMAAIYEEKADGIRNKPFWKYALGQMEKARDAFNMVGEALKAGNVPLDSEQMKNVIYWRADCIDHLEFFQHVCEYGLEAALERDDEDFSTPFRGIG